MEGLKAFIDQNFDGYDASQLILLADRMTDKDVEALTEIIFGKARDYATYFNPSLALILLGTADTQRATSWGEHAAETLENSQVVHFPETGHGAIRFSQCAKDVGAAFLNTPGGRSHHSLRGGYDPAVRAASSR